jgi:hypothetical protein
MARDDSHADASIRSADMVGLSEVGGRPRKIAHLVDALQRTREAARIDRIKLLALRGTERT